MRRGDTSLSEPHSVIDQVQDKHCFSTQGDAAPSLQEMTALLAALFEGIGTQLDCEGSPHPPAAQSCGGSIIHINSFQ